MSQNSARLSAPAQHAAPKVAVVFIAVLSLAAGCSKWDAPAAKSSNAPMQETAKTADAPKKEPTVVQEAIDLAAKCAVEHWTIQEDGALWSGHWDKADYPNDGGIVGYIVHQVSRLDSCDVQFKPVTPHLVAEEIPEADRLNGVEWQGDANFSAPAFRFQLEDKSWMDWQTYKFGTFWSVRLDKRNGQWTAKEQVIQVTRMTSPDGISRPWGDSLKSRKPATERR